jgi:hypothetical protein
MTRVSVLELRQYALRPGEREVLVGLFDRELAHAQEACGMRIIGTFRDLDDDSKFVWLRSFPTMAARGESLRSFYGGPVWKRNRTAANATMVDSDDVLLLRPGWDGSNFASDGGPRLSGPVTGDRGTVQATILRLAEPADTTDLMYFSDEVAPLIQASGASVLACLVTEQSENNFPVLPIREGEHSLVWFAGIPRGTGMERNGGNRAELTDAIVRWPGAAGPPQTLRLEPTENSRLTGVSVTGFAAIHDRR